ncbi:MAG: hypothetical protein HZY73_12505 [Micropruina sp.]|nr:MAG: hypothetical protein HZY73_12505 [Micropruina sp.]
MVRTTGYFRGIKPFGGTLHPAIKGFFGRPERYEPAAEWVFKRCSTVRGGHGDSADGHWFVACSPAGELQTEFANAFLVYLMADILGLRSGEPDPLLRYYYTY